MPDSKKKVTIEEMVSCFQRKAEARTGKKLSAGEAAHLMRAFGEAVVALALSGKDVGFTNFGTFKVINMKGFKAAGLPGKGNSDIPDRRVLRFYAAEKNKHL